MPSRPHQKLRLPLVTAIALVVMSCGGKAAREQGSPPAGGAAGAVASGGQAGVNVPNPKEPDPSAVVVSVNGNKESVDPQVTPECLAGFQGFQARVGGMSLDFKAFVFKPGDYEGDPVQILWLDVRRDNGEQYRAAAGSAVSSGSISLHVEQVGLRFVGSLEALAPGLDDPSLAPLKLTVSFDIAVRDGCP